MKDEGYDFIKIYSYLDADKYQEVIAAAKALDMYTAGHIPFAVGMDGILEARMDEIAHIEELTFELMWGDQRPTHTLSMDQWLNAIVGSAFEMYGYEMGSNIVFDPSEFDQIQVQYLDQIINSLISNHIPVGQ